MQIDKAHICLEQIEDSIESFFEKRYISSYTLAGSANVILLDLLSIKDIETHEFLKSEIGLQLFDILRKQYTFLKHAKYDPCDIKDFQDYYCDEIIILNIWLYHKLGNEPTKTMRKFLGWKGLSDDDIFKWSRLSNLEIPLIKHIRMHMKSLSRDEQLLIGKQMLN